MSMLRLLLWPFGRRPPGEPAASGEPALREPALSIEQYEAFAPIVVVREGAVEVTFCTPNRVTKTRAETLFSKEPDTIEWIRGFAAGEVLLDVGANVGMYSIWAAKSRGARVFAFEPESQNYALLHRNIMLNRLDKLITGYCAALADRSEFSLLHLSGFHPGGSCHTFGESVDYNLRPHNFTWAQGCYSTTLDSLVEKGVLPVPNHIKIDVDGIEHRVIAGCRRTLEDMKVRSVLVEINTNLAEHRRIVEDMGALGFHHSDEQVASSTRREGAFKGTGNHVFRR